MVDGTAVEASFLAAAALAVVGLWEAPDCRRGETMPPYPVPPKSVQSKRVGLVICRRYVYMYIYMLFGSTTYLFSVVLLLYSHPPIISPLIPFLLNVFWPLLLSQAGWKKVTAASVRAPSARPSAAAPA